MVKSEDWVWHLLLNNSGVTDFRSNATSSILNEVGGFFRTREEPQVVLLVGALYDVACASRNPFPNSEVRVLALFSMYDELVHWRRFRSDKPTLNDTTHKLSPYETKFNIGYVID